MAGNSVWDEFEFDPRIAANSGVRASDADRDVVHRMLGRAYAEGRLTRDEFDQRSDAVLGARTLGALPALLGDLLPVAGPPPPAASPGGSEAFQDRAVTSYRSDLREAAWGFVSVSIIVWVIWGALGGGFPWPVFVTMAAGLNVARMVVMRADLVETERARLERKARKALEKDQRRSPEPGDDQEA
ncbi:MAG: DUF1707 domain-containing protein [Candidatus Nanopelagicales bacterium]